MTVEYDYELVIVGGGPAGSSAAYSAAKNGIKVALLEKEESISQTVRTSGVTWMKNIEEFGIPKNCYNPISKFSFCSPNNEVTISSQKETAAVLDVRKTYQFLATRAAKHGADIFVKTNVIEPLTGKNGKITGVVATSAKEKIIFNSKIVIDASGFNSVISKSLGYVEQWSRFGVGAEFEAYVDTVDEKNWWLMVGQAYSPSGYAWIFPLNKNRVRIGVGVGKPESDIDPTLRLREIISKKMGPVKDWGRIVPLEFHYGLIPNEGLSRKTVFDNLILVGDSAGQANPLVLEGIRYAIKFGEVAGQIAAKAIQKDDTSSKVLQEYENIWKKEVLKKIKSASKVQERWINLSDEQWDKELDIIKNLSVDEFLDFIKADFGLSNVIKLAANHPIMAVRQLFSLVKNPDK